jgi:hypothetical protein
MTACELNVICLYENLIAAHDLEILGVCGDNTEMGLKETGW